MSQATNEIAVIVTNKDSGMAQFSYELVKELSDSFKVHYIIPHNFEYLSSSKYKTNILLHTFKHSDRIFNINGLFKILSICKEIQSILNLFKTDVVVLTDNTPVSLLLPQFLKKRFKKYMFIHDGLYHLTSFTVRNIIAKYFYNFLMYKAIHSLDSLIFLSKSNKERFFCKYHVKKKNYTIRLCAHIDNLKSEKNEIDHLPDNYYLFYGRIEKYKGLQVLLKAYQMDSTHQLPNLIIAGKGIISKKNLLYISQLKNKIILINRYINDSDTIYLFENSLGVILPYIEASQSGIIPIAYKYSKPVFVSNIASLTENVIDNKTGFVFKNRKSNELLNKLIFYNEYSDKSKYKHDITEYYHNHFNWKLNLKPLIEDIKKES